MKKTFTAKIRHFALVTSVAAGALLVQSTAFAFTGDVTIDDLKITEKESVTTIKRIEVLGSNLEKSEILKLFATDTKSEERAALLAKLQASKFSIPEIQVSGKDQFKGVIRDFLATGVDKGKVAKLTVAGFEGGDKAAKGPTTLKVGAIALEGADLSSLLETARSGKPPEMGDMQSKIDRLSMANLDMSLPDDKTSKDSPGGNMQRITIASVEGLKEPKAGTTEKGSFEIKNMTFEFAKGSETAKQLLAVGYDKLDLGMKIRGSFDETAKKATVDEWTISGANMGAITIAAKLENMIKAPANASNDAKIAALMAAQISSVQLSFANSGIFEKGIAEAAKQQKTKPEDLKAQMSAMAGTMLPAILAGDPAGKTIGDALTKFISNPKNVTIGATAKGAPLPIASFMTVKTPADILSKVNVTATANQ
jgi:hypothetical protein